MVGGINACLDEIENFVDTYGCISVEDLLDSLDKHHLIFTGVDVRRPRFTDRKYGWIDSDYFTYQPVKGGYKINIPWNQIISLEEKEQTMLKNNKSLTQAAETTKVDYSSIDFLRTLGIDINDGHGWKSSITNPDTYELRFDYVYDALGLPHKVRKHGCWTVSKYEIRDIYFNAGKNTTVVVWETGEKTKVKMADGENCFINNEVASAVMKRKYGSNSAFKAHVDKMLGGYSDSAYLVLARAETSEIYGSYDNFDKLVKEKLILSSSK